MTPQAIRAAKFAIVALALAAIFSQVLVIPRLAAEYARSYPDLAYLAVPYTITAAIGIIGFEIALVAAWRMLTIYDGEEIDLVKPQSFWVNVLAFSLMLGVLAFAGICGHAAIVENIGGPPTMLGLVTGIAFIIMAAILRKKVLTRMGRSRTHHS